MKTKVYIFILLFVSVSISAAENKFMKKGRTLYYSNRFEISLIYFKKAITKNPEYSSAYLYIGNIYTHKKRYAEALQYYSIGLDLTKNKAVFLYNMAQAHYYKKNYKTAITKFKESVQINTNLVDAHLNIGRAYYCLSDKMNTINEWETYQKKAPNNPQFDNITKAIEILKRKDFLFPDQKRMLDTAKRKADEEKRKKLRHRIRKMMLDAERRRKNQKLLTDKDVKTKVKDVNTKNKGEADYNKGEDIERD